MKTILLLMTAAFPLLPASPVWDSTGNAMLNGAYNFRQVLYVSDGSGNIGQQIAYFGAITFHGDGTCALSGSNTLLDTGGTLGIPANGTYSPAGSGYGFLSDPLIAGESVYFLVSNGILTGSSTESPGPNGSFNNDLFIAAPATPAFNNASSSGSYTIAGFLPGSDVTFPLHPDGAGNLETVSESGYNESGSYTASVFGASYSFSDGVGLANIILQYGSANETLYLSPDTNFVFGGSPNGYDVLVGVRNPTIRTSLTSGLYYEIGLDEDASQYASNQTANIDTYYGVFNAFSNTVIGHERLVYAGSSAEGVTYTTTYPAGSYTGPADIGQLDPSASVQYMIGANGIRIGFGIGPWLGIEVALPAAASVPTGTVYIDPAGVVDTARSAPFTAGISPGEFISLYNGVKVGSSSTPCASGAPFPPTLGGIQVLIDGIAAPIYCVGSPLTVIVPYEASAFPIATIQVINGSRQSNIVTAFVYPTTPGVFSLNPIGGIGYAAAEHGNYSVITSANPALPGEEIAVYVTGLGNVFPVNGVLPVDGGLTPPKGDPVVANVEVDVAGFGSTSIPYEGLSPDPGLYQINFVVPLTAPAGNDFLALAGPNSYTSEALLPVGTGPAAAAAASAVRRSLPRLTGTNRR